MVRSVVLLMVFAPAVALCQTPEFSGTWKLEEDRSRVSVEAPLAGLIGAGAPGTLHITQPANGTLVVESEINESHARLYIPGGRTTTPIFLGTAGTITMTTRWEDQTLVSEGTRDSASSPTTNVKETFALSADGQILDVAISIATGDGTSASTLRYGRIQDVGPCESWPSPCKDFSSLER
ncbi:MAG: hypothetical protein BMS9Abin37_1109 [Acidobacteriota bacterium]|nr:MAG: hypothetical protein BMS9Abin37_1109 [Acidobacteriota bacterium]